MIVGIEEKAPTRNVKHRLAAARLSPLEMEVIDLFVQFPRLLGHPCKVYNILGSPGITWGFFIGWIEGGAKKTELLE